MAKVKPLQCSRCGANLDPKTLKCGHCGLNMNEKNREMKERYATEQVRKELAEEDRGYSLGLLVILLLVFLPIGVVYYLYSVKCKDLKKEIEILKSKIKEQEQPEEQF
jgi:ribosomal protein L37E